MCDVMKYSLLGVLCFFSGTDVSLFALYDKGNELFFAVIRSFVLLV